MLKSIHLSNVGPAGEMAIEFAPRLNFLTGDNGVGKSFVLDAAWWTLTHAWARGSVMLPTVTGRPAWIRYLYSGTKESGSAANWAPHRFAWEEGPRMALPGIVVYAGVDGGYSAWDRARNQAADRIADGRTWPPSFSFSAEQIWTGASGPNGTRYCNGLIHDWVSWQKGSEPAFHDLKRVLEVLSPSPEEVLTPGPPVFLGPIDETEHPTLRMPYGQNVPLIHASAGMRRIAALAYLLVWVWNGHQRASKQMGSEPAREIIFLIDEIESHLHPQWQRRIVPALLRVMNSLTAASGTSTQVVISTHSPLVLASVEPEFDEDRDAVFNIALRDGKVVIDQIPWAKQGDVTGWLVSEAFGLQQARSIEAERAIEAAEAIMRDDAASLPENLNTRDRIDAELRRVLAGHDPFWPRWIVWTENAVESLQT